MNDERFTAYATMQESKKGTWLIIALGLSFVLVVGMLLPWVSGIDFGSFIPAGVNVRGWNVTSLRAPFIIGVVLCIWLALVNSRWLKLLVAAGLLVCCAAILIPMVELGALAFSSEDERFFGIFLVTSAAPMIGFWVTLLAVLGMVGFGLVAGIQAIITRQ